MHLGRVLRQMTVETVRGLSKSPPSHRGTDLIVSPLVELLILFIYIYIYMYVCMYIFFLQGRQHLGGVLRQMTKLRVSTVDCERRSVCGAHPLTGVRASPTANVKPNLDHQTALFTLPQLLQTHRFSKFFFEVATVVLLFQRTLQQIFPSSLLSGFSSESSLSSKMPLSRNQLSSLLSLTKILHHVFHKRTCTMPFNRSSLNHL